MLGCTNVNYGTDSVDLCDGGWCYGDHNCASNCCDMSHAPYNQVCTHDGHLCAGNPDEGLRAWAKWLIALTVMLVVGIFVFCFVRAYIRRKRRREGGGISSPTSSVNTSRRSSVDSEHRFAE